MNNSLLHLTYREMRQRFINPRVLGILGLVSLALGLSGPFQTFDYLSPVPRVVYWAAICSFTFAAGEFAGIYVLHFVRARKLIAIWQILACGVAAGLAVWPVVVGINWIAFGEDAASLVSIGSLLVYCVLIATVVTAVSALVMTGKFGDETGGDTDVPATPKIVSRLPLDLRGQLVSLSVQDHYVEVVTVNGAGLVHFRLLDALDDCDGVEGLQIHRSHWVARAGIKTISRRDGKVFVETTRGDLLPVSRTYLPKVKELGLLV